MTNLSELSENSKKKTSSGGAWNFHIDHVENWAFMENVFTPEECKKIIEIGNNLPESEGLIYGKNKSNRKSFVSWITPNLDTEWIFKRMTDAALTLNSQYFGFDLNSFSEGFQFTKYYAPDGRHLKHIDRGPKGEVRKLSLTVQLNDSSEFEGGNLMFHFNSKATKPEMKQGKMIAFPSYTLHEVTVINKGTRYSLVGWISGPPFR